MTKYWCVNFDFENCLNHGIKKKLWLMQYQYADEQGHEFQGGKNRKGVIRKNWEQLEKINIGDRFVAYLKPNTFYAIGEVRAPRRLQTPHDATDSIRSYLERKSSHNHKTGYVYYTPVFYEDFTDNWRHPDNILSRYPARIDVENWEHYVPDGISVKGLNEIRPDQLQLAVFEISKDYFDAIETRLAIQSGTLRSASPDGPAAVELAITTAQITEAGYFSPTSLKDEREKKLREIVERRGQPDFRNKLIATYGGRCVVTRCDAIAALEAAHINPYIGPQSHHVTNGLLLRADIHTLFDLDLIGIDPATLTVVLAPAINTTVFSEFHGTKLTSPANAADGPNSEALVERWMQFGKKGKEKEDRSIYPSS